jgi:hypothetical protein
VRLREKRKSHRNVGKSREPSSSAKDETSAIAYFSALDVSTERDPQVLAPPNRWGTFTERLIRQEQDTDNGETRICYLMAGIWDFILVGFASTD